MGTAVALALPLLAAMAEAVDRGVSSHISYPISERLGERSRSRLVLAVLLELQQAERQQMVVKEELEG